MNGRWNFYIREKWKEKIWNCEKIVLKIKYDGLLRRETKIKVWMEKKKTKNDEKTWEKSINLILD